MAYDPAKHLIRIQGNREYLPVAQRLVWFRESHPDWGIETKIEVLDTDAGLAVFSATVINENGKVMARATKMETARGFPDYISGDGRDWRALCCSFGTQFAPELRRASGSSTRTQWGPAVASGRIGARRMPRTRSRRSGAAEAHDKRPSEGNPWSVPGMRPLDAGQAVQREVVRPALCPQPEAAQTEPPRRQRRAWALPHAIHKRQGNRRASETRSGAPGAGRPCGQAA